MSIKDTGCRFCPDTCFSNESSIDRLSVQDNERIRWNAFPTGDRKSVKSVQGETFFEACECTKLFAERLKGCLEHGGGRSYPKTATRGQRLSRIR